MKFVYLTYPLRALIAVLIGLVVYKSMHTQFSIWILLTVVVLLQSTVGTTFERAAFRVIGTLLGVLVGMLLVSILPFSTLTYSVFIFISLFFVIYTKQMSYVTSMFFAGIMVVLSVSLFIAHGDPQQAWKIALDRFVDTLIGAVIVILCAYLLWPNKTKTNIYRTIGSTMSTCKECLQEIFAHLFDSRETIKDSDHIKQMYTNIKQLQMQQQQAQKEPGVLVSKAEAIQAIIISFFSMYNNLVSLRLNRLCDDPQSEFIISFKTRIEKLGKELERLFSYMELQLSKEHKKVHEGYMDKVAKRFLQVGEEVIAFEKETGEPMIESERGIKISILLLSIKDICIKAEFIIMALKQMEEN